MKLKEIIKDIPKDEVLFIGASSSYLFIGTKQELMNDYKMVDNYLIKSAEHMRNVFITQRRRLQNNGLYISQGRICHHTGYQKAVDYTFNRLKSLDFHIPRLKRYLETYTSIMDREVVEVAEKKLTETGTKILIDGGEIGQFWFKHEYDEKYHKSSDKCMDDMIAGRMCAND